MTTYRPKTITPRTGSKCRLWIEERQAVTLAPTTTTELTDTDIGLSHATVAYQRAVEYLKAATAFKSKQEAVARKPTLNQMIDIAICADEIEIVEDADLIAELERVAYRPRPSWLNEMPLVTSVP